MNILKNEIFVQMAEDDIYKFVRHTTFKTPI